MGYQWISRFLANDLVCCDTVMEPFACEILARLAETGDPIPLILDPTKVSDRHQIRMLSVRWGERALPLAWRVAETEGAIGFATQQELLEVVARWRPAGQAVILLADRFSGTAEMIRWCREPGWDYRLRLKGNLVARWGATRTTTGALALLSLSKGWGPLFRGCRPHRQARHDQYRHPPRSRTWRTLDYRHVGHAGISDHLGLCRALGHRTHVLRRQIARVRPRTDPYPISRPPRLLSLSKG
jgi:hypothetical protein